MKHRTLPPQSKWTMSGLFVAAALTGIAQEQQWIDPAYNLVASIIIGLCILGAFAIMQGGLSGLNAFEAQDERENYVKTEAGYFAFKFLMSAISIINIVFLALTSTDAFYLPVYTVIFWITALVLGISGGVFTWRLKKNLKDDIHKG